MRSATCPARRQQFTWTAHTKHLYLAWPTLPPCRSAFPALPPPLFWSAALAFAAISPAVCFVALALAMAPATGLAHGHIRCEDTMQATPITVHRGCMAQCSGLRHFNSPVINAGVGMQTFYS